MAEEEPMLSSDGGRSNGVLHEVVVELEATIFEIDTQQRPIGERVIDGLSKGAARQITTRLFEEDQSMVETLANEPALAAAHGGPFPWTGLAAAQVLLDAVEMSDLTQDPSATLRRLLSRLVQVASRMGPASCQGDLERMFFDEAPIGQIGVALQSAMKVWRDHILEALCGPTRLPMIEHIAPRR